MTSGWAVDEPAVLQLARAADNAGDTLTVDAKVLQIKVEWTAAAESD